MKTMMAAIVVLALAALVLSCQAPQEFVEKMENQSKAVEELGQRVDALEAKLGETTTAFNDLAAKFDEHMEKQHKKQVTTKRAPTLPPPRKK